MKTKQVTIIVFFVFLLFFLVGWIPDIGVGPDPFKTLTATLVVPKIQKETKTPSFLYLEQNEEPYPPPPTEEATQEPYPPPPTEEATQEPYSTEPPPPTPWKLEETPFWPTRTPTP